jgi:hypothetical protein
MTSTEVGSTSTGIPARRLVIATGLTDHLPLDVPVDRVVLGIDPRRTRGRRRRCRRAHSCRERASRPRDRRRAAASARADRPAAARRDNRPRRAGVAAPQYRRARRSPPRRGCTTEPSIAASSQPEMQAHAQGRSISRDAAPWDAHGGRHLAAQPQEPSAACRSRGSRVASERLDTSA